jgi:hypothetical protein
MAKDLDIVFLQSKGFIPSIIRKLTKCEYNHVGIIHFYEGDLYVFEAVSKGFIPTSTFEDWKLEKDLKGEKWCVITPKKENNEWDRKVRCLRIKELVGKKYEFISLLFYQLIYQISKKWIGTKNTKRVICSEAVAYVYRDYFPNYFKADPQDIYDSEEFKKV